MTGADMKRLAHGLFGKPETPDFEMPFDGELLSLAEMVKAMLELSDQALGLYAWSADPLAGKFSLTQKTDYMTQAIRCGREEAKLIQAEYQTADPDQLAGLLGLKINEPELPVGGGHVIFAQYVEPDEVTIFTDAVRKAEVLIREENLGELLEEVDVRRLLLAHEIFHAIEYRKSESIFTKTEKVELWRKPFSNRSGLIALSEIAGMAFAGELLGISFSPYVFDVILMYGYNKEAAAALFEEIMELAAAAEEAEEMQC